MGRNKFVSCTICSKSLRSDKIKLHEERHRKQHGKQTKYQMKHCSICKKSMIAGNLTRHIKVHNNSKKEILENIISDQKSYEDLGNKGKILKELMDKEDIDSLSLRKDHLKALEVNSLRKQQQFESLNPWQEKLLSFMEPSKREIIWVCGVKGAEGKSWFQGYLEHHYTHKKVFRTSIDRNKESILHSLSKKTLSLLDVFVFNIPRSFDIKEIPYTLFEDIKDGFAISTKYDSKQLRFNIPNIVIIFSNTRPVIGSVSKDRWRVYNIINEELRIINIS